MKKKGDKKEQKWMWLVFATFRNARTETMAQLLTLPAHYGGLVPLDGR